MTDAELQAARKMLNAPELAGNPLAFLGRELLAEIDVNRIPMRISELVGRLDTRVRELEIGIDGALHELGEPGPGYPAPVANAVEILRALASPQGDV